MRFSKVFFGKLFFGKLFFKKRVATDSSSHLRTVLLLALSAVLALPLSGHAVYKEDGPQPKPFIIKGQLEVRFTNDVSVGSKVKSFGRVSFGSPAVDAVLSQHKISEVRAVFPWRDELSANEVDRTMSKFQLMRFSESVDLDILINDLMATGKVVSAEKIWAMPLLGTQALPDDPRWNLQYAPARIQATDVWDVETGSDTAKIALTDSGVNYRHEDLVDNVWVNPGEDLDGDGEVFDLDDLNGVDDDGNGVIDDLIGYDFFTGLGGGVFAGEDAGIPDPDPNDHNGHGTHVAGIAAAASNNGLGVAGIAGGWNGGASYANRGPRIMCLRIGATGSTGQGFVNLSNAATAIDYAARMGADVVNTSWGSSGLSSLVMALDLANDSGIVISNAAGNDNADSPSFLALRPDVTTVASTDGGDVRSGFSNFGSWVEISAPGSAIHSTFSSVYTPTYATLDGTSMAAPAYCGAVLLIKSLMPGWTKVEIDSILLATADNIDAQNPGFIGQLGAGRVNPFNAIQNLPVANFSSGPTLSGAPGLTVDFTDLSPNSPTAWSWTFGDGNVSSAQNPSNTYNSVGIHDVTLTATDPNGDGFEQAKRLVFVYADTLGGDTAEGSIGDTVDVPFSMSNDFQVKSLIIPLTYAELNGVKLKYIGITTAGLRAEQFEVQEVPSEDPFGKKIQVVLRSSGTIGTSPHLQPGEGPIVAVRFEILPGSVSGNSMPLNTVSFGGTLAEETLHGAIVPAYIPSVIKVSGCCLVPGDADGGGTFNIGDATFLIARIFNGGPPPPCNDAADANGDNSVNIADVTYMIARIFSGGPAPICGNTGT
jgi:Subtilase family/PKD domain